MNTRSLRKLTLTDADRNISRNTKNLVISLAGRLSVLTMVSGSEAVGSIVAGLVKLGREVGKTAEGMKLRKQLESNSSVVNGNALWSALDIDKWVTDMPPSQLLDHIRNDMALILADDLLNVLAMNPQGSRFSREEIPVGSEPATFVDCVLGLWAHSKEILKAIECLATEDRHLKTKLKRSAKGIEEVKGSLLR